MSLAYSPTRGSRWSFMISSHRGLRAGARRIWARTSSPTVRLGWWVMATMWWLVPPPGSRAATRTPRPTSPTTSTTSSTSMRPRVRQGNQLRHPKRRPPVKEFRRGHLLKTQPPAVEVCNWRGHLLKITQMGKLHVFGQSEFVDLWQGLLSVKSCWLAFNTNISEDLKKHLYFNTSFALFLRKSMEKIKLMHLE